MFRRPFTSGKTMAALMAAALFALAPASSGITTIAGSQTTPPTDRAFLDKYCLTCHTEQNRQRGIVPIALDKLDPSNVEPNAEAWEKVIRKVRSGVMPPPGAARPEPAMSQTWTSRL